MDEKDRYEKGLGVRRQVLGNAHVDAALKSATPLTSEFQDLITRYAWGEIWTRPAFDHKTRRLFVLAMMIALNRRDEFKMHLRAALRNGEPVEMVKEVILLSAIYCGLPAANNAFHDMQAIIDELEKNEKKV